MKRNVKFAMLALSLLLAVAVGAVAPMLASGALKGAEVALAESEEYNEIEIIDGEGVEMQPTAEDRYELICTAEDAAPITMPSIFANGMVFQRGKTINVFGFTDDLEAEFKVTLGEREGVAAVDESGRFYAELDAIDEPTWNLTLKIEQTNTDAENMVVISNVAVGEVWVISGQSNAQLQTGYLEDVEEQALLADSLKNVRAYRANPSFSLHPDNIGSGSWITNIKASTVRGTGSTALSAVGYVAVARLAEEFGPDMPVALIHVARGASKIKTWLDYESLRELSPSEADKYDECVENGALVENAHTQIGTCLYNKQIAPLEGYEVAGVMWYQGCGDANGVALGIEGTSYTRYFTALERVYRRVFGEDGELPFYVMELAPYTEDSAESASVLAEFKAEQYAFCRDLPNTYLVSNMTDGGVWGESLFSQGYIHPGRKSTIGMRAAELILVNSYGYDLGEAYTNPNPVSAVVSGNSVVITFDTEIKLFFGNTAVGFELRVGKSWVSANAVIEGKTITLTAANGGTPTAVRYGHSAIVAELQDGTMIEFLSGAVKINKEEKTLTFTKNGQTYVISDATGNIRSIDYGNVTNASGIPLPVFTLQLV